MISNTFPAKKELNNLYHCGKSMAEIAKKLDCSIHKIVYWMDKYKIKRRSPSNAAYVKANPNGDPFRIKYNLTPGDKFLFGIAIGLYLGEGNKVTQTSLRIANSDPKILKLFILFLHNICRLDPKRISASIVCFNDTDPEMTRTYWANQLSISSKKFGKITQIPTQGKGTYRRKSKFGVCTIQANNVKLSKWFRKQLEITGSKLLPT